MAVSYRLQISKYPIDLHEILYQRDATRSYFNLVSILHNFLDSVTARGAQKVFICVSGALVPRNIGDCSDVYYSSYKKYKT
jgi:hypothetical protein